MAKAKTKAKPKKKAKSRVNEAGNYTKPSLRKRLFSRIKAGLLQRTKKPVEDIKTNGRTKSSAKAQNDFTT